MQIDDGVEKAPENKKLFFLFVLHEEFFCLKDVVVEVEVVDLEVPNMTPQYVSLLMSHDSQA